MLSCLLPVAAILSLALQYIFMYAKVHGFIVKQ